MSRIVRGGYFFSTFVTTHVRFSVITLSSTSSCSGASTSIFMTAPLPDLLLALTWCDRVTGER